MAAVLAEISSGAAQEMIREMIREIVKHG